MSDIINWVKANVKDDANVAELEELVEKSTSVDAVLQRKDVKSELDRQISKAVESYSNRFREEKLPSILDEERDKIRKELHPEETQEQKRIRELEEKLARADKERQTQERRAAIRKKAQDLGLEKIGLSPDDVEPFAVLGDDADSVLESFASKFSKQFETTLDAKLKERFGDAPPKAEAKEPEQEYDLEAQMRQTFLG